MIKRIMMKQKIILMAVTAFVLAAEAQAINVTVWRPAQAQEEDTLVWDAIVPDLTEEARQAGDKYAYASQAHGETSMGIWSSDAHSLSAIAANRGIARENLVSAMEESSEYRSEILYLEQQTLIEACLANLYINQYRIIKYLANMTRDALQLGDKAAYERQSLASPTDWVSVKLQPVLVNVFGAEDVNGAVAATLGYNVLYFRQMAYLETARVRLGGVPIFDYSFDMTHVEKRGS